MAGADQVLKQALSKVCKVFRFSSYIDMSVEQYQKILKEVMHFPVSENMSNCYFIVICLWDDSFR